MSSSPASSSSSSCRLPPRPHLPPSLRPAVVDDEPTLDTPRKARSRWLKTRSETLDPGVHSVRVRGGTRRDKSALCVGGFSGGTPSCWGRTNKTRICRCLHGASETPTLFFLFLFFFFPLRFLLLLRNGFRKYFGVLATHATVLIKSFLKFHELKDFLEVQNSGMTDEVYLSLQELSEKTSYQVITFFVCFFVNILNVIHPLYTFTSFCCLCSSMFVHFIAYLVLHVTVDDRSGTLHKHFMAPFPPCTIFNL